MDGDVAGGFHASKRKFCVKMVGGGGPPNGHDSRNTKRPATQQLSMALRRNGFSDDFRTSVTQDSFFQGYLGFEFHHGAAGELHPTSVGPLDTRTMAIRNAQVRRC